MLRSQDEVGLHRVLLIASSLASFSPGSYHLGRPKSQLSQGLFRKRNSQKAVYPILFGPFQGAKGGIYKCCHGTASLIVATNCAVFHWVQDTPIPQKGQGPRQTKGLPRPACIERRDLYLARTSSSVSKGRTVISSSSPVSGLPIYSTKANVSTPMRLPFM